MGPGDLSRALAGLPFVSDPNLIAGIERSEDAGIYKLGKDLAIVQTLDFFTPIVDDPFTFGQVAAANALSDVYAKGGRPLTAMNIVAFPLKRMDISVLHDILAGGLEKLHEAGVALVGGHSVEDDELKYGLSVTGVIRPSRVVLNNGARPGDRLILTKPLGTGIISTAIKGGLANEAMTAKIIASMTTLNKVASELMMEVGVHAATDVTGFGLVGHAAEMLEGAAVGLEIDVERVPFFPEAADLAGMGVLPGGLHRNREHRRDMVDIAPDVPPFLTDILFDPQTSGGLLIAVSARKAGRLLDRMHQAGIAAASIIGRVKPAPAGRISLR